MDSQAVVASELPPVVSSLVNSTLLDNPGVASKQEFTGDPDTPLVPEDPTSKQLLPNYRSRLKPPATPEDALSSTLRFTAISSKDKAPITSVTRPPEDTSSCMAPGPGFSTTRSEAFAT